MMSDYALKVENLTKKYDGFLLDKVSFYVPKGNIVGLIGENGAGKSTTINTMLEIVQKDSGDIYILDSKKIKLIMILEKELELFLMEIIFQKI